MPASSHHKAVKATPKKVVSVTLATGKKAGGGVAAKVAGKGKVKKASAIKGPAKKLATLKRSRQRNFVSASQNLSAEEMLERASVFPVHAKSQILSWPEL